MKRNIFLSIGFLAILGFTACNNSGYKKLSGGVSYKLLKEGKSKDSAKIGDVITIHLINTTEGDSVVIDSHKPQQPGAPTQPMQFTLQAPQFKGDLMEGLLKLHKGDSAVFIIPSDSLFRNPEQRPAFIKKGSMVKTYVTVVDLVSKDAMMKKQAEEAQAQIAKDDALITSFIAEKGLKDIKKTETGIYYIITKAGSGATIEKGKTAIMNYTGKLLDGNTFDSNTDKTFNHVEPFKFKLGQGQVIRGWDEGVALLNKGAKATFIIPSTLGYGPQAMGDKIPANSVLLFDVELIGWE